MRIPPYVAAIRKCTIYGALLFAVLFSCIAIIQYAFVRHEVYQTISRELHESADEIAEQVAPNGKWKIQDYRKDASIPVTSWYIITSEGLIIDVEGFQPGFIPAVKEIDKSLYQGPQTVDTKVNEKWRLLGKKITGGSVILGISDPVDIKVADKELKINAEKFGSAIHEAVKTASQQMDTDVDCAVVSDSDELMYAGGVPLKTDPALVIGISKNESLLTIGSQTYFVVSRAILDPSSHEIGRIIVPRDVTPEQKSLDEQRRFNFWLGSASWILVVICISGSLILYEIRKQTAYTLEEALKIGESKNIEFKRSFLLNNAGGNENTESPELGILKTVGAFLNSNGGSLYIGVNDDRTVQGIDADLNQTSIDVFAQKISNLIANRIGTEFSPFIKHRIAKMGEKTVYILDVLMSPRPAFVKSNNKARFYIREGVITKDLDNEQMYRYTLAKRR